MKELTKSIFRKFAYVAAACLTIAALLVIASRLFVPMLDTHRPDIERWASDFLDRPVKIEKVRLSWYRYQPVVSLQDVTLLDKTSKEPLLQVKRVSVLFSILRSLWHWNPVLSGILISGTDINVHEKTDGEYSIQGFPGIGGFDGQPYEQESKFADTLSWLAKQPRIILRDIDIRYTGFTGQKRFVTLYDLNISNSLARHVITGKAILHQDLPTEVALALEWQGDPTKLSQLSSNMYLYISGLSLSQWLGAYAWQGWELQKGIGSAKIWANWDKGQFQRIQSKFQLYELDLFSQKDKSNHLIRRFSGDVGWERKENRFFVAGEDILIDLPDHLWPLSHFQASLVQQENKTLLPESLSLTHLDLGDLQDFIFSSSLAIPEGLEKTLKQLQPKGALQNLAINFCPQSPTEPCPTSWEDPSQLTVEAGLKQIQLSPWEQFPGMKNLSATLIWDSKKGNLKLNSKDFVFQHDSLFAAPIKVDQLSGDIGFQRDSENKSWQLELSAIQVLNSDVAMNASGKLTFPLDASPVADIKASFTLEKANRINHYLPLKLFDQGLITWMRQAFLSGEVKSGNAVLQGPLNEFPFESGNGVFRVEGKISHVDFHFAPDWPLLKQVNGNILFSGRKIEIDVDQAKMLDMPVNQAHGVIPYLGPKEAAKLTVEVKNIETDFLRAARFIRASPLEKTIGRMFKNMELSGPVTLELGLTVPLSKPEDTQVRGVLDIKHASILLPSWNLALNQVQGRISFTENIVEGEGLEAQLFGKPVKFSLQTIKKSANESIIQAKLASTLKLDDLETWLKIPFSKFAKGSSTVTGVLDLSFDKPFNIHLESNLKGISLDLPDRYSKKAETERKSSVDILAQEAAPLKLKFEYGDLLSAALVLDKKNQDFKLLAANLRLGGGDAAWPQEHGLYITGRLEKLSWDEVKPYMGQGDSALVGLKFRGLDINIGVLDAFGLQLANPSIKVIEANNKWNIDIDSSVITGLIVAPKVFSNKEMISAHIKYLNYIPDPSKKNSLQAFDVSSLPLFDITINELIYNHLRLGRLVLSTAASANGQTIKSLRLSARNLNLQASGFWTSKSTRLSGNARSEHFSEYLNSMGVDAHNFISNKAHFDFTLSWQDMLFSPSLASLSGKLALDLGPGRIVEVGEDTDAKLGLGRMLSLFSLQTIPRRLSLDFSDLFQKGYSFDFLRGHFNLQNGDAFTTDTRIVGPVANVEINGRIGLYKQDFDLTLGVTPIGMTSTLPVAAAWLAGPVGGVAALAVTQVIGSQISKVASHYYEVRGPWANPSWKQVQVSGRSQS